MRVTLLRKRERERQESNHDQQILIERLQSGNNWDNCSTLGEGRTNRTRDGLKDTVLGRFQTQSEIQIKSDDSNRRLESSGRNGVSSVFLKYLPRNCLYLARRDIISVLFVRFSRRISLLLAIGDRSGLLSVFRSNAFWVQNFGRGLVASEFSRIRRLQNENESRGNDEG